MPPVRGADIAAPMTKPCTPTKHCNRASHVNGKVHVSTKLCSRVLSVGMRASACACAAFMRRSPGVNVLPVCPLRSDRYANGRSVTKPQGLHGAGGGRLLLASVRQPQRRVAHQPHASAVPRARQRMAPAPAMHPHLHWTTSTPPWSSSPAPRTEDA